MEVSILTFAVKLLAGFQFIHSAVRTLQPVAASMQGDCTNPSQSQNEVDLKRQLSRALLHFQDRLLEANISPGSLCQVEPVKRSNHERRLRDTTATDSSPSLQAPSDASYLRLCLRTDCVVWQHAASSTILRRLKHSTKFCPCSAVGMDARNVGRR